MSNAIQNMLAEKKTLQSQYALLGMKVFTKDHLSKVLAFTYVFGGGNEAVTHNVNLASSILLAQEEAKLKGGCVPDLEYVKLFQKYASECAKGVATWLEKDIFERYRLEWKPDLYLVDITKYFSEFRDKKSFRALPYTPDISMLKALNII